METIAIPSGNDERISWTLNFESKFPPLGAELEFSSAETTALTDDSRMMRFAILNAQEAASFSKSCTAYKNALLGGVGENVAPPHPPVYSGATTPPTVAAGILKRLSRAYSTPS